ncbi:translation initiation factor IF-3 [Patescibacteria group bacterium]|nr:translation initiation factor IF-3 [Patescibacteria group bacterium]
MGITRVRINKFIRAQEVLLIDETGKKVGAVPLAEALKLAEDANLDLVEVAPNLTPPVCKILDFGKYQYAQAKLQMEQRKQNKTKDIKEMRLGLKISDHDLGVKSKKVNDFLGKGHKVKITVRFKGREIMHRNLGHEILKKFLSTMQEKYILDKETTMQGKQMITFISPSK